MSKALLIYGASGYTGQLAARMAVERNMQPVLAGRNEGKIARVADELQLPYRIFSLENERESKISLEGVGAVLHCAGPFSATSRPMVDACLAARTHYLDITGEISVFEAVLARDEEARKARIVAVPGVGFDVVPTDCLAALLVEKMPDATHLELAIHGLGSTSPGTTKTMIEGLPDGGAERIDGEIKAMPIARLQRKIEFMGGEQSVFSIPWGDVSTAYHSTGVPNIVTYMVMPGAQATALKLARPLQFLLRKKSFQTAARSLAGFLVSGPDAETRASAYSDIWGEVRNGSGQRLAGLLRTPEGYSHTVDAALRAVQHVLYDSIQPGAYTPSKAFGARFVAECDGVQVQDFLLEEKPARAGKK